MKHSKVFIVFLSIFLLTGCNNPVSPSSSESSSASSIAPEPLPAVDITNLKTFPTSDRSEFNFALKEFGKEQFEVRKNQESRRLNVSFSGKTLIRDISTDYFCASDVNSDGYRELFAFSNEDGYQMVIYDVHNSTELFRKDLFEEAADGLANPIYKYMVYSYYYEIKDKKLALVVCNGMASRQVYDYAFVSYSAESGVTFQLQNMYDIDHMALTSIKEGETAITPSIVQDKQVYSLKKGVKYAIDFEVIRKENPDLDKVIKGYSSNEKSFPANGIYPALGEALATENVAKIVATPSQTNYFGTYTLELTLPEDAANESYFKVAYCGLSFQINYTVI
jgi:hypothetical protein